MTPLPTLPLKCSAQSAGFASATESSGEVRKGGEPPSECPSVRSGSSSPSRCPCPTRSGGSRPPPCRGRSSPRQGGGRLPPDRVGQGQRLGEEDPDRTLGHSEGG